ncbi:hypothetical protein GOP47_0020312, partial [Adiantum capillus-veneris]
MASPLLTACHAASPFNDATSGFFECRPPSALLAFLAHHQMALPWLHPFAVSAALHALTMQPMATFPLSPSFFLCLATLGSAPSCSPCTCGPRRGPLYGPLSCQTPRLLLLHRPVSTSLS